MAMWERLCIAAQCFPAASCLWDHCTSCPRCVAVCVCGLVPGLGARLRISASCTLRLSSLPLSWLLRVLVSSPILLPPLGGAYVCGCHVCGARVFPRLPPSLCLCLCSLVVRRAHACGFVRVVPCQSALSVYYAFLLLLSSGALPLVVAAATLHPLYCR